MALEVGRFTATSTVESGAATMKMISSTSVTSMKGVTLMSAISSMPSPVSRSWMAMRSRRPERGAVEVA